MNYAVGSRPGASAMDKVGSFSAQAIWAPPNQPNGAKAFQEEAARMLADGFTAEELAGAKTGYLQSRRVALSNDGRLAGALTSHLLERREFRWDEKYESWVRALTPHQMNQAMRQFIDPSKLIVMSAGDFSKIASDESDAPAAFGPAANSISQSKAVTQNRKTEP